MGKPKKDSAIAMPTKPFFVSMLTRDISLEDAILDLIDNCLDGALRIAQDGEVDYSKHFVEVTLSDKQFTILDNCGGISRDIAINYAFKMGRDSDDDRDSTSETIGMYGVGMKRAIFKMGRDAMVQTLLEDDSFEVPILSTWLDQKGWEPLPILTVKKLKLKEPGTFIRINALSPGVSRHFASDVFKNKLVIAIAEHFTMFLQRGLKIIVNDKSVEPVLVEVLVDDKSKNGPAPYIFQEVIDGVTVSIAVGLNTPKGFSLEDEDDAIEFERDRSSATAGWTVFCNDRAVIVGDKSRLTGWGDGVPLYHYQFSIISGIIEFRSKHADILPVTTTKRALDTTSDIWLRSLVKMKEAMRVWITYTNAWKNHPRSDQAIYWLKARPLSLRKAIEAVSVRAGAKKKGGSVEFNPQKKLALPMPPEKKPTSRRIVFSRPIEEIREVSKALFDNFNEKPGLVGDQCFERVLRDTRKGNQNSDE